MLTFLNEVVVVVVAGVFLAAIGGLTRAGRRRWEVRMREKYAEWKHRHAKLYVHGFDQHGSPTAFDYDNPVARAAHALGVKARRLRFQNEFPDLVEDDPPRQAH